MKLSSLFGDGMVLQRDVINTIWGYTMPECHVNGTFENKDFHGIADKNGYFEIDLPQLPKGGPYQLEIKADEKLVIQDILVGDVFLLGGQSNMELPLNRTLELYDEELKGIEEPWLRFFEVPKEFEFQEEREMISETKWIQATGEDLYSFSAAGFFLAKEIKEKEGVPIGLIQTAVGGAPAKSFLSEKTILEMGEHTEELLQCKQDDFVQKTIECDLEKEQKWIKAVKDSFKKTPYATGKVTVPGIWNENELSNFHGGLVLKKKFYLSKGQAEGEKEVLLGSIIDADYVYINDTYIGETGYKYPPRIYKVPEHVLKEGENTIEIQMMVFRDTGGFVPDKVYGIRNKGEKEIFCDLTGEWEYGQTQEMEVHEDSTFFIWKPAALYNGMLSPIRKWNIRGCFYYQGESDVGRENIYEKEMEALVSEWRILYNKNNLPFIYVQLPGYSDCDKENQETDWARLRDAQEHNLSIPYTRMAVGIDVGEYNDLHPLNKKAIGKRLALCARDLIYGEDIVSMGPKAVKAVYRADGFLEVLFETQQKGLMAGKNGEDSEAFEVEIVDKEGITKKADAIINEDKLLVSLKNGEVPKEVRYAYRNCPMNANLYNREGLPALPFRIVVS